MSCNKKLFEVSYGDEILQDPRVQEGGPYWKQLESMPYLQWKDEYSTYTSIDPNTKSCPYTTQKCQYTTQGEMVCKKAD
jgi:hypothetical protein